MLLRKTSVIMDRPLGDVIPSLIQQNDSLKKDERLQLAILLQETGLVSQRQAHEITGVSRDTIRKHREKRVAASDSVRKMKMLDVKPQLSKAASSKKKLKNKIWQSATFYWAKVKA